MSGTVTDSKVTRGDAPSPSQDEPVNAEKSFMLGAPQDNSVAIASAPLPRTDDDETGQGRDLMVRVDGDRGTSLTEKALHYFHRLTWRTPLHRLRLKGRAPLRLMASPDDPIRGDKKRGMAIRAGHFLYNGMKQPLSEIDFADLKLPPLFKEYVHGFRWLRDLAEAGPREKCAPIAEKLMNRWLNVHAERVSDPAWRAEYAGARILFWSAHAPLILSSGDLIYRSRVLRNLARTARHLDHGADKAEEGLPRLIAWCGVVAASLIIPEGKPRQIFGEAGLKRTLTAVFDEDGGVISRAPLMQIEAIAVMTMLQAVYIARKEPIMPELHEALTRAVPALRGVTHHDGSLGSWQGSAMMKADRIAQIIEASGVRARPLREARHWGYQRVPAGKTVLLIDAGTPPLTRHAVTGCASTLAFEMSHGSQRLIVNCGGAAMAGAFIPAALAKGLRATAAHSTLCLGDSNSTAILPHGKLGKGVNEVELDRRDIENATRLDMSHDGYAARYGLTHRRILLVRSDGSEVRGEDILLPTDRTGRRARRYNDIGCAIRFHLGMGVEAHMTSDAQGALMRLDDGSLWQLRCAAGALEIDESLWVDERGRPHPTQQVVIQGQVTRGGGSFGWIIKKMG